VERRDTVNGHLLHFRKIQGLRIKSSRCSVYILVDDSLVDRPAIPHLTIQVKPFPRQPEGGVAHRFSVNHERAVRIGVHTVDDPDIQPTGRSRRGHLDTQKIPAGSEI